MYAKVVFQNMNTKNIETLKFNNLKDARNFAKTQATISGCATLYKGKYDEVEYY